jgi:hypothetical protein
MPKINPKLFFYNFLRLQSVIFGTKSLTLKSNYEPYIKLKVMKGLSILAAFLGGAAVGAACGILFAPEKGEDTRERIIDALHKRGIRLDRKQMNDLVDDIADELKAAEN